MCVFKFRNPFLYTVIPVQFGAVYHCSDYCGGYPFSGRGYIDFSVRGNVFVVFLKDNAIVSDYTD